MCRASTSFFFEAAKTWMAGTSPAMTKYGIVSPVRKKQMLFLGALLFAAVAILLTVASRRGAPGVQIFILSMTALIFIPVALFGVIIMGFSDGVEDTRTGVMLLTASAVAGGSIAIGCISRMKKPSVPHE
jgi:hypothetical protein